MAKTQPKRDYKKTLLSMAEGSIGTTMFRHFWVSTDTEGEFDSVANGELSCAFYVSSLLTIMGLSQFVHGTVSSLVADMEQTGWYAVEQPEAGDVIVWASTDEQEAGALDHIGFYMGANNCISNSSSKGTPHKHSLEFDPKRRLEVIYRCPNWNLLDEQRQPSD